MHMVFTGIPDGTNLQPATVDYRDHVTPNSLCPNGDLYFDTANTILVTSRYETL